MLEQAADPGMVHALGGWSCLEGLRNFWIVEECTQERLQSRICKAGGVSVEFGPKLFDIPRCFRNEIAELVFGGVGPTNLVERELQLVLVARNLAPKLDDIPGGKLLRARSFPHAGLNLTGAVAKGQSKIGRAILLAAHLFHGDSEKTCHQLIFKLR